MTSLHLLTCLPNYATLSNYYTLILQQAPSRIDNFWADLWPPNVIHGERWLRQAKHSSLMMADVSDILLALWGAGVLQPIKFRPSHSRAAFLGLMSGASHGRFVAKPDEDCAADWDWLVLGDYTTMGNVKSVTNKENTT